MRGRLVLESMVWGAEAFVGEALEMEVTLRSEGSGGRGITVDVGGAAVEAGLLSQVVVSAGPMREPAVWVDAELEGTQLRAELPQAKVPGRSLLMPLLALVGMPGWLSVRVCAVGSRVGAEEIELRVTPIATVDGGAVFRNFVTVHSLELPARTHPVHAEREVGLVVDIDG